MKDLICFIPINGLADDELIEVIFDVFKITNDRIGN
jgi:hypothetical protein